MSDFSSDEDDFKRRKDRLEEVPYAELVETSEEENENVPLLGGDDVERDYEHSDGGDADESDAFSDDDDSERQEEHVDEEDDDANEANASKYVASGEEGAEEQQEAESEDEAADNRRDDAIDGGDTDHAAAPEPTLRDVMARLDAMDARLDSFERALRFLATHVDDIEQKCIGELEVVQGELVERESEFRRWQEGILGANELDAHARGGSHWLPASYRVGEGGGVSANSGQQAAVLAKYEQEVFSLLDDVEEERDGDGGERDETANNDYDSSSSSSSSSSSLSDSDARARRRHLAAAHAKNSKAKSRVSSDSTRSSRTHATNTTTSSVPTLTCNVCEKPMTAKRAHPNSCEHLFCEVCLRSWLGAGCDFCPTCDKSFTSIVSAPVRNAVSMPLITVAESAPTGSGRSPLRVSYRAPSDTDESTSSMDARGSKRRVGAFNASLNTSNRSVPSSSSTQGVRASAPVRVDAADTTWAERQRRIKELQLLQEQRRLIHRERLRVQGRVSQTFKRASQRMSAREREE